MVRNIKFIYESLYIKDIDTIVISDLHLGFEAIMASKGIFLPRIQYKKVLEKLHKIVESIDAGRIIIDGDIKHEFSETSYHEFKEVSDLLKFLKKNFNEIILIKGNHDNYIERVTKRFEIKTFKEYIIDKYYFVHGHKIPEKKSEDFVIVMGHEHPAIVLKDEIGIKTKYKCFLIGSNLIVIPSFSYYSYGTNINTIPKDELLSPILKKYDLENLDVYVTEEDMVLNFGKLKNLIIA